MYKFPSWVGPRNADGAASRRLRYLVLRSSIECTEKGSITSLAALCDLEAPHVHMAIRDGGMSAKMAAQIEKKCGRRIVRREWLIHPLDFEEMV